MDIKQLQCFLAVAERLNFTRAAKDLQMTQSGISYQIATMEKAMDAKLFLRNSRSVRMTEAGEFFYRRIRTLMSEYDSIIKQTTEMSSRHSDSLTIGFLGGIEMKLLPSFSEKFRLSYPDVEIKFKYFNIMNMNHAITNNDIDMGFTILFDAKSIPDIITHVIFSDHSVVMVPAEHVFSHAESLHLSDLKGHPVVALTPDVAGAPLEWLKKKCRLRGFILNVVELVPDFNSLSLAVESGMGLSVHSHQIVEENAGPRIQSVRLVDEDCTVDFAVAWKRATHNPNVQLFLEAMGVNV